MASTIPAPSPGVSPLSERLTDLASRIESLRARAGLLESLACLQAPDLRNELVECSRDDLAENFQDWRVALEEAGALLETIHGDALRSKELLSC